MTVFVCIAVAFAKAIDEDAGGNISQQQMTYVTHSEAGEGLIFYGNVILPFIDRFPQNTELYRVMTTKPGEVSA